MANQRDESTAVMEPEVLEVQGTTAMEAMVRGEIDIQIATAKRYPRSLERFKNSAIAMATIDEETAESCLYRRPVGKKKNDKTGKWEEEYAEGMSIRMAEIVGACYGNLRVGAVLVEQTPGTVRARGMAHDLETNFASSSEVIESTLKADGSPYSQRMRIIVAKATLSKARRDATFQVVPKALAKPVEAAVRAVLLGDAKTLDKRRQMVVAWITKVGIEAARVYGAVGAEGPADLTAERLETLTGLRTAIKDGETTIDDAFPPLTAENRDHLTEELAHLDPPALAKKLKTLFDAKRQSKGQALAFLRQYAGKLDDLVAVLEAMPVPAANGNGDKNGAEEPQQRETRSREMPSAAAGPVGGSAPHQQTDEPRSKPASKKTFQI